MTDNTQPEAGSTHIIRYALEMGLLWIDGDGRDKVREALDALDTLEAQLEAIGAGGVNGPLVGQQTSDSFTAADMATAEARGFRDGVASVAANAPAPSAHIKEPYTLAEIKAKIASNDYSAEMLLQHAMLLLLDGASLSASAGSEPVAEVMFADGKKYIQYTVPKELLPVGAKFYLHPSPPEGMVGGWTKASQQLPPCRDDQLYVGINTAGFAGVFNAVIDIAGNVHCTYATPEETIDVMGGLDIWQPLTPPTTSAGSGKGE